MLNRIGSEFVIPDAVFEQVQLGAKHLIKVQLSPLFASRLHNCLKL